jgi:VCBS repeat-containing protein
MADTEVWTLISGTNTEEILDQQNTGTNSASSTSILLGSNVDSLHDPSDLQFDTAANLYFLVDNEVTVTDGNPNGAKIEIGTITGAENNQDTLRTVFTDTSVGAQGIPTFVTGMAVDVPDNSIYLLDQHGAGLTTTDSDTLFERISFSGANFTGTATVTQLATLPGPLSSGMVLDTTNPSAETAYFVKSNNSVTSQGSNETVSENAIVKATWNVSSPNAVTITSLPFANGFTAPQEVNGSSKTFSNFPAALGTLGSIAINPGHTLYFLATPVSGGTTLYSYSLTSNSAGSYTAIWHDTSIPLGPSPTLSVDPATGQYYITADNQGSGSDPGDAIYVGSLSSSANPTEFYPVGQDLGTRDFPESLALDNAPMLTGVTGTTTEAVQGGAAVTLLTGQPTISDSDGNGDTVGATIQITNGKTGDELFVNGVQSGTLDGVTISWNSSTYTLTLSGTNTFSEYQSLLASVSYQDTGTDTTTSGHPTRSVSFTVSDGLVSSTASTTTVTVDRPPAQTTHNVTVGEGGSTGTLALGDTDPDGDSVTVMALTGGTVGSPKAGTYGSLTINSNDTYSYTASNTTAINAAATGSHPIDTFTYQVSDGNGGVTTETLSFAINRPPVINAAASVTYHYSNPATTLSSSATVTDPDGDKIASATVQITGGTFTGDDDQLAATTTGTAITAQYNASSETLTLTGSDTAANYDKVLDSVTFDSTNTQPTDNGADPTRTVTWTVNDGGPTGSNLGTASETIDIVPCYCPGTRIRTARGEECVEKLKIGDRVMTASGVARPIKWIGRRFYGGRFIRGNTDVLPICIKTGALGDNVPKRDLWVSPHHAVYFKDIRCKETATIGVLIEALNLVNGVSIVQSESVEKVEYFHIELETHDVLIAEGALAESFIDDDTRYMFHNAHEHRALYPDAEAGAAQYCAPRLDEGYEVDAARRRIALRAGLLGNADGTQIGRLDGFVDEVSTARIVGWARSAGHPQAPVCLDIYVGACLIGQVLANRYREDLEQAGLGSGCHSFEFTPPVGFEVVPEAVEVRRSLDGAVLGRSVSAEQPSAGRALRVNVFRAKDANRERLDAACTQAVRTTRRSRAS